MPEKHIPSMFSRQHPHPPAITLVTLNAKYIHASLGLRYLLANMGDLRKQTALLEFTISRPIREIVDHLLTFLGEDPAPGNSGAVQIVGFGVYIWNVRASTEVVRLLRAARPEIKIILGGPEVSHETEQQEIVSLADHVITGWGDLSFARLCRALLNGSPALPRLIPGEQPALDQIALPYDEFSESDLAHRLLYVEASRGCPFKCEFCLSALDKTALAFDPERFLAALHKLYQRGARHFKFVDRTFNLKIDHSIRILQFFLDRLAESGEALFLHFEVIPDHLPERLKQVIARFPPGVLQFEVGIQSLNDEVQRNISRRQDNRKSEANLRWLLSASHAHLHTDLIFGLPGETLESFAAGFDRLYALQPHEIQLGILKRLRGTPMTRQAERYGLLFDPLAPYLLRQTAVVDAATVERFARFSRYWDVIANSGRFRQSLPLLLSAMEGPGEGPPSPFYAFLAFSDWLWQRTGTTGGLSPETLLDRLFDYLCQELRHPPQEVRQSLLADYLASGARSNPQALQGLLPKREITTKQARHLAQRQARHRAIQPDT